MRFFGIPLDGVFFLLSEFEILRFSNSGGCRSHKLQTKLIATIEIMKDFGTPLDGVFFRFQSSKFYDFQTLEDVKNTDTKQN